MAAAYSKERITDEMLDEILEGEDLSGLFHSGELFAELRRKLAERILDAEMDVHLSQPEERIAGNVRNGHNPKTVVTDSGPMPLEVPRDRQGTFEPQLVEKYCRRLPGFDDKVIHLFSRGLSTRRIRETVRELYGIEVSPDLISRVTDVVMEEFAETAFLSRIPVADGVRASLCGSEMNKMKKQIFFKKKRPVEMWTTLSSSPHSHEAQQQQFTTCPLTCSNLIDLK